MYRALSVLLALAMAGTTEVAQAWQTQTVTPAQQQSTTPAQQQTATPAQQDTKPADQATDTPQQSKPADQPADTATPQQQAQPATQQVQPPAQTPDTTPAPVKENNASDPTHVPTPGEVLPNAPSTQQDTQTAPSTQNSAPAQQKKDQQPLGTAAAEKGVTTGGAASKPAGIAVAGKKQNQSRGLLIKVGAALAAGAALGTVYALSRGTSPTPPGAR